MEEERKIANKRLKTASDELCRRLEDENSQLDKKDCILSERLSKLKEEESKAARDYGNVDANAEDLVEVNAGGKIISAKRSTLTQLGGTRLEALFSGRWDKKLQRDSHGRIFLDVNPVCFRAIADYLNEMAISSEDNPPSPPSVDDEHEHILRHHLELFGLCMAGSSMPDSKIIQEAKEADQLHSWLEDDESDGNFNLLYRGSRDGMEAANFHSRCDNQDCTLTIIETTNGYVLGGYSNTPWTGDRDYHAANKAFLFVLSGTDVSSPTKMKLKDANDKCAVYHSPNSGPVFGDWDMWVKRYMKGSRGLDLRLGNSYASNITGRLVANGREDSTEFTIKEMEVFDVTCKPSNRTKVPSKENENQRSAVAQAKPESRFSENVNAAINARRETLVQAELEIIGLEDSFKDEQAFITAFVSGDAKNVVTLNVSGTMMAAKRSTLMIAQDSVLAQQFDDTKWTEHGCNTSCVQEWTPDDVKEWAKNIQGIQDDVGGILKDNEITGCELLALNIEVLKMMGISRAGTLGLLLEEIKTLKMACQTTLIEHSPYCFGKILDYLRLKRLHSLGLIEEPAMPQVCDSQKSRFEKVVRYYFPGDTAKFILG